MPRYIAHLIGHPAKIDVLCGCTAVKSRPADWFMERMGFDVTIEVAERRMLCPSCNQRPRLKATGDYGVTGGRDRRVNPPPMPDWVDLS